MKAWGVILTVVAGVAHAATDADLRACRAIADKNARLACYDAMPIDTAPSLQAAPAAPGATATATKPAEQFGLSEARRGEAEQLESRIAGRFEGWRPKQRLTLANGQVWRIADDSSAHYELTNPRVTIRRGLFGAFYMDIEGVNQSPRVRRER